MKAYSKKLLTVGTILVAFAVGGCATSTVPPMPSCETEEQLTSAEACKAAYSCCTRACAGYGRGSADEECVAACAASLEECYGAVE